MPAIHTKVWITSGDASRRLGCSPLTVYRLSEQGHISHMSLPGIKARRFKLADVERLVAQNSGPSQAEDNQLVGAQN